MSHDVEGTLGTGVRADSGEYATYATSVYALRDGDWKLALHRQTPIPETAS